MKRFTNNIFILLSSAKGQLTRPYYLLGEIDRVLKIINERKQKLIQLGDKKTAAASISTAIHIHITRGNLSAAKDLMTFLKKNQDYLTTMEILPNNIIT